MDEISVTTKIIKNVGDPKPRPRLCVAVEIGDLPLVNYEQDLLAIDLTELAKSLDGDGEYFVITCACGDAGCAGINEGIQVSHAHNTVRWRVHPWGNGQELEKVFTFQAEAYRAAVKHGLRQFLELYENNPDIETTPYLLRERVEFAKKQAWLANWLAL